MRAVHTGAAAWSKLADDPKVLRTALERLIERGLFYLRYTTGDPLENMKRSAVRIVEDYVRTYSKELARLEFETGASVRDPH
jgi:DNA helicase-2/ATP-dependent DNA helicase PcrA